MKSYGKATAMIAVLVMIAAAAACIIPMQAEMADGDIDITSGDMQISAGQKKVSIISMNDNAFEFEDSGDGIVLSYATGDNPGNDDFKTLLEYNNNTGDWIWDEKTSVAQPNGYTIDVDTSDKIVEGDHKEPNGTYTLIFEGKEDNGDSEKLTIRVKITSHGAPQTLNYEYAVRVYDSFDVDSTITYTTSKAVKGGEFNAAATVKMDKISATAMDEDDLYPFIFYASGLNPGVALMSKDLSIKGSIPADLNGWLTDGGDKSTSMSLDIAVTDTRTGYVYIVGGVSVNYNIADPNGLDYTVSYSAPGSTTDTESWSEESEGVEATLISGGRLTITGTNGIATIIYDNGGSTVTDRVQLNGELKEIDITGTGEIRIIVSVLGVDEQTLEFTIIDDMIPINDIGVTCGPKITP